MSGQSNSVLDDIVGAFTSVGRTLLAVVGAILALIVGLALLAVGAVFWAVSWVLWKLRLSKVSPRQRFQRVQMWLVGKWVQRKMRQAGVQTPGNVDLSAMFQGQMGDFAQQMQKDIERVRAQQAGRPDAAVEVPRSDAPSEAPVAARSAEDSDVPEVAAEEVGEYQGSVEELVKRRRS